MSALATIRPSEWELPLFVHLLGAMALVGALALAAVALAGARRDGSLEKAGLAYHALLRGALPSWLVMYVGALWLESKEFGDNVSLSWIDIGHITSEAGLLLIVAATVTAGVGLRRARRREAAGTPGGVVAVTVLVGVLLLAYLVAIWAMTTKPV